MIFFSPKKQTNFMYFKMILQIHLSFFFLNHFSCKKIVYFSRKINCYFPWIFKVIIRILYSRDSLHLNMITTFNSNPTPGFLSQVNSSNNFFLTWHASLPPSLRPAQMKLSVIGWKYVLSQSSFFQTGKSTCLCTVLSLPPENRIS